MVPMVPASREQHTDTQMVPLKARQMVFVVEDALLAVHAVLGDVLVGDPPFGGQVVCVPGVQEGVVAGLGRKVSKAKETMGEDAW